MRPDVSAPSSGRCMLDCAEHGVDAEPTIDIFEATFPGSSRVTSMGTPQTTFLVDEYLILKKIKNIPSI